MFKFQNTRRQRVYNVFIISIFMVYSASLYAQSEKKYIRQGNKAYEKNNFSESEISYRKAIDKNNQSPDAIFNVGDALYKQNKYEDAGKQFIENTNLNENKEKKSSGLYNLGNSLLMSNKIKESIEAYKGSLKLDPDNIQAKYNLAYAQDLLKKQEEQKQQQQQEQNKENQDKNKEDQKNDGNEKEKEQQDNKPSSKDQQQKEQQQQQQTISKEDAQRLLNALANDEKDVQEKVKLAKAAKAKVKTLKNW